LNIPLKKSIAGASLLLISIGLVSKGLGFFREIVYASTFGLSSNFDLFLISSTIPIAVNTAVFYIAQHYFIPNYHKNKSKPFDESLTFFNFSFYSFIIASSVLSLLLLIFSTQIINLFLVVRDTSSFELAEDLFLLFLFTVPLNAGIAILTSYTQSEFRFILSAAVQLLINIVVIFSVMNFSNIMNIYVLPIAFIIGNALALIILVIRHRRIISIPRLSFIKSLKIEQYNVLLILILIEFLSLSYPILDRLFYSKIPSGGIAALYYAINIYSIPVSIFTIALITALFPKFSEQVALNSRNLVSVLKDGININVYLIVPVSIVFFFSGFEIVRFFFERGHFNLFDSKITGQVLTYYSISLVFYSTYLVVIKLLYSLSCHLSILLISILGFILKMILNFIFVDLLEQNGLALSSSLVFLMMFVLGYIIAGKKLKINLVDYCFKNIGFHMISGILAFSIVYTMNQLIILNATLNLFFFNVLFLLVYFYNSFILNNREFKFATEKILKIFHLNLRV
jgi:putative peptidoglycan lipid II flippase